MRRLINPPRLFRFLVLAACSSIASMSYAEDIRVLLVDTRTAKPIAGRALSINLEDATGPPKHSPIMAWTGPDGVAMFHPNSPLHPYIWVFIESGDVGGCAPDTFSTEDVLRRGIVADKGKCDAKGKLNGKFLPKPGEIVIFGWKRRWWERGIT